MVVKELLGSPGKSIVPPGKSIVPVSLLRAVPGKSIVPVSLLRAVLGNSIVPNNQHAEGLSVKRPRNDQLAERVPV